MAKNTVLCRATPCHVCCALPGRLRSLGSRPQLRADPSNARGLHYAAPRRHRAHRRWHWRQALRPALWQQMIHLCLSRCPRAWRIKSFLVPFMAAYCLLCSALHCCCRAMLSNAARPYLFYRSMYWTQVDPAPPFSAKRATYYGWPTRISARCQPSRCSAEAQSLFLHCQVPSLGL